MVREIHDLIEDGNRARARAATGIYGGFPLLDLRLKCETIFPLERR